MPLSFLIEKHLYHESSRVCYCLSWSRKTCRDRYSGNKFSLVQWIITERNKRMIVFFLFAVTNNNVSKYFRLLVTYDSVEVAFFFLWAIIFLSYCKHRKNNNKKKTEGQRWWWHQQQHILSWVGRNWKVNNICLHVVVRQKKI